MQGASIKITGSDGSSRTVPFEGMQLSIGRTADNDIVLEQVGVSSHHCVLGRDPTGSFHVRDQGSTNGTWIGDRRVEGSVPLEPGTQLIVGSYLLSLELPRAGQLTGSSPAVRSSFGLGVRGPLIRKSDDEHAERRFRDRVARYAREWDEAGRPGRLLLRGRNLGRAVDRLEHPTDPDLVFDELSESFVRESIAGRERNKIYRVGGGILGAVLVLAAGAFALTHDWGGEDEAQAAAEDGGEGEEESGKAEAVDLVAGDGGDGPSGFESTKTEIIEHRVVPAETLEEIALHYDVPLSKLARRNGLGETEELVPGTTVEVEVNPLTAPLPRQNITYRTESRESWSSLAKRFDVPVAKLRAYNPELGDSLDRGTELSIWIDPKPLEPKQGVTVPDFPVRPDAISVGAPKGGKLINGIQFPKHDDLYKRRYPYNMYCGSHMAKHLLHAIADFRYTYNFEGEFVVADMSRRGGGKFKPHKSHQSGRDVDIWLPTLKGVYKKNQLTDREYRPQPEEADWFALYGFLKSLHATGEAQVVFLDYTLHDRVYKAAKLMGATDEELDTMIAYPRGKHHRKNVLLQHSAAHTHHVHVRFKCGPNDEDCSNYADPDPGD